jgi:hypothetical protein
MITRRASVLGAAAATALSVISETAFASSYLRRASLLLDGSRRDRKMVRARRDDRELLLVVHRVAAARALSGRRMRVSKLAAAAHPHLLLVLENCERAYAAGLRDDGHKFVEHIERARSEDLTFRAIIERLGLRLPR